VEERLEKSAEAAKGADTPRGVLAGLETIANIVKALTTPVLAVIVAVAFYDPIVQIVQMLPEKFRDADKFSAVGLTVEIQRTAIAQGNPQLAQLLGEMSRPTLRFLLRISDRDGRGFLSYNTEKEYRTYYLPEPSYIASAEELERKGLYDCEKPIGTWKKEFESKMEPVGDGRPRSYKLKNPPPPGTPEQAWEYDTVCRLNDTGKFAYELIVEAVAQQFVPSRDKR
jgi:hypothetical protein